MKKLGLIFAAVFPLLFASCTAEINIVTTADGVEISFNGAAEKGFEKLINSVSSQDQAFIDTAEISNELAKTGFTKVSVSQKTPSDLSLKAVPQSKNNFLFESGLLFSEGVQWKTDFSRDKLLSFYNSSNTQFVQFLDLLLAPAFNDEEMSVDEYLEVIASFYGDSVAEELAESKVKVTSRAGTDATAAKWTKVYSLPEILCGLAD